MKNIREELINKTKISKNTNLKIVFLFLLITVIFILISALSLYLVNILFNSKSNLNKINRETNTISKNQTVIQDSPNISKEENEDDIIDIPLSQSKGLYVYSKGSKIRFWKDGKVYSLNDLKGKFDTELDKYIYVESYVSENRSILRYNTIKESYDLNKPISEINPYLFASDFTSLGDDKFLYCVEKAGKMFDPVEIYLYDINVEKSYKLAESSISFAHRGVGYLDSMKLELSPSMNKFLYINALDVDLDNQSTIGFEIYSLTQENGIYSSTLLADISSSAYPEWKNDNELIYISRDDYKLYVYNLKSNEYYNIDILGSVKKPYELSFSVANNALMYGDLIDITRYRFNYYIYDFSSQRTLQICKNCTAEWIGEDTIGFTKFKDCPNNTDVECIGGMGGIVSKSGVLRYPSLETIWEENIE